MPTDTKNESLTGKKFTPKDEKHFARGKAFTVLAEGEFDFTGHGRKTASVTFRRDDSGAETIHKREKFLAEFEPLN